MAVQFDLSKRNEVVRILFENGKHRRLALLQPLLDELRGSFRTVELRSISLVSQKMPSATVNTEIRDSISVYSPIKKFVASQFVRRSARRCTKCCTKCCNSPSTTTRGSPGI
ncbi:MAG: hypothetical protein ABIT38_01070 [Gemmatimonadaceae bacterium]